MIDDPVRASACREYLKSVNADFQSMDQLRAWADSHDWPNREDMPNLEDDE
ncbi:MAG: hypothetical protein ACRCZF_09850 [Gemmataceae bacterium]